MSLTLCSKKKGPLNQQSWKQFKMMAKHHDTHFTAANVSSDFFGKENRDNDLREHAIKETISSLVAQEGGLHWMSMEIDLGTKVTEEEPEITFSFRR